jgi:hypothetical protein
VTPKCYNVDDGAFKLRSPFLVVLASICLLDHFRSYAPLIEFEAQHHHPAPTLLVASLLLNHLNRRPAPLHQLLWTLNRKTEDLQLPSIRARSMLEGQRHGPTRESTAERLFGSGEPVLQERGFIADEETITVYVVNGVFLHHLISAALKIIVSLGTGLRSTLLRLITSGEQVSRTPRATPSNYAPSSPFHSCRSESIG